jgi:translocation and assembly module TamB
MLPAVRRTKRRDWGRVFARILCVLFAFAGLVPVGIGLLVRTSWARGIATRETQKIVSQYGVDAKYDLELRLWPLSLTMRGLHVASSDGGDPFITAKRVRRSSGSSRESSSSIRSRSRSPRRASSCRTASCRTSR